MWASADGEAQAGEAKAPEQALHTYAILTTDSSPRFSSLHNRMPVLLYNDAIAEAWMAPLTSSASDAHESATALSVGQMLAQVRFSEVLTVGTLWGQRSRT